VALAYWLRGDGTYNKTDKYIKFYINSFSLQVVVLLQDALLTKLEIYSTIQCFNHIKE
jgi:hypothetical protein